METNAKHSLRWTQLGPDLSKFCEEQLALWLRTYGEIRLRYVAHLTWGMHQYEDPIDWSEGIDQALKQGWISGELTQQLAQPRVPQSARIPWSRHYLPHATERQLELIDQIAFAGALIEPVFESVGCRVCDDDLRTLAESRLLEIRYELHPDLSYESVVQWLSFIVNGANDPQLMKSYMRHRPDLVIDDYAGCVIAWESLIGR